MNKHPSSSRRAIPSCEMARIFSFIYDRFDGNSLADMLDKSTSDWIRRGRPARKNMYYHYSAFLNFWFDLFQAWSLWSHSRSFNFPPAFACSLIAVFSFLVRFFRFFELVHVRSFVKELHQGRCLVADQLSNRVTSSSHMYVYPAKVV